MEVGVEERSRGGKGNKKNPSWNNRTLATDKGGRDGLVGKGGTRVEKTPKPKNTRAKKKFSGEKVLRGCDATEETPRGGELE